MFFVVCFVNSRCSVHDSIFFPRDILYTFFSFLLIYDGLGFGVLGFVMSYTHLVRNFFK